MCIEEPGHDTQGPHELLLQTDFLRSRSVLFQTGEQSPWGPHISAAPVLEFQVHAAILGIVVSDSDRNMDAHAYTESTLHTESSAQPCQGFIINNVMDRNC